MLATADHDEIRRQIRRWLAHHFDFLPLATPGGGELQQLTDGLLEGWMRGAGTPARESRDALGKLAAKFTRQYYDAQLDHLLVSADSYPIRL